MTRKTRKRKDTVWIPHTMQLIKKVGTRSLKRARFLVRNGTRRMKRVPSKVDRVLSNTIRRLSRRMTR